MKQPIKFYGSKEAGTFLDDLGGGFRGMGVANQGVNPLRHPIDAVGNLFSGFGGGFTASAANRKVAPMESQGIRFDHDKFGGPTTVNFGGTAKGLLGQAGNWMGQHKGLMLGGLGTLAGLMLMKRMMSKPKTQFGPVSQSPMPNAQQGQMLAPQTFQKQAGGGFSPFTLASPVGMAEALAHGLSIPGMGHQQQTPQEQPTDPYNPDISTTDPRLQKLVHDPRMRAYLTHLVEQQNVQ